MRKKIDPIAFSVCKQDKDGFFIGWKITSMNFNPPKDTVEISLWKGTIKYELHFTPDKLVEIGFLNPDKLSEFLQLPHNEKNLNY